MHLVLWLLPHYTFQRNNDDMLKYPQDAAAAAAADRATRSPSMSSSSGDEGHDHMGELDVAGVYDCIPDHAATISPNGWWIRSQAL